MKIIDSKIIDSGFEKFNGQKILKLNLGYAAMRTLCTNTRREYVIDCSLNKKATGELSWPSRSPSKNTYKKNSPNTRESA